MNKNCKIWQKLKNKSHDLNTGKFSPVFKENLVQMVSWLLREFSTHHLIRHYHIIRFLTSVTNEGSLEGITRCYLIVFTLYGKTHFLGDDRVALPQKCVWVYLCCSILQILPGIVVWIARIWINTCYVSSTLAISNLKKLLSCCDICGGNRATDLLASWHCGHS